MIPRKGRDEIHGFRAAGLDEPLAEQARRSGAGINGIGWVDVSVPE
jgi:hypothetical protein